MYKTAHGWEATEGNGGPGMYERVEKFVTNLTHTPEYLLDLRAQVPASCIDENEYNEEQKKLAKP
jgi:hypothetical protein